jgi:hypothetical protein
MKQRLLDFVGGVVFNETLLPWALRRPSFLSEVGILKLGLMAIEESMFHRQGCYRPLRPLFCLWIVAGSRPSFTSPSLSRA